MIGLPGVCVGCRAPVRWGSGAWRTPGSRGHVHRCPKPAPMVCGAWMPVARERCARRPGHGGTNGRLDHRTRFALDNALYMATGRRVA